MQQPGPLLPVRSVNSTEGQMKAEHFKHSLGRLHLAFYFCLSICSNSTTQKTKEFQKQAFSM